MFSFSCKSWSWWKLVNQWISAYKYLLLYMKSGCQIHVRYKYLLLCMKPTVSCVNSFKYAFYDCQSKIFHTKIVSSWTFQYVLWNQTENKHYFLQRKPQFMTINLQLNDNEKKVVMCDNFIHYKILLEMLNNFIITYNIYWCSK